MITEKDREALRELVATPYRIRRLAPYGLTNGDTYTRLGVAAARSEGGSWPLSAVHVVALVKNAVEMPTDPDRHFGATSGIEVHRACAQQCQLLATDGSPTEVGRELYMHFDLGSLPDSRANTWNLSAELATVLRLLAEGAA